MKKRKVFGFLKAALLILATAWLAGCASLSSDWEEPQVALTTLRMLEPDGLAQRFEVGLSITNPNDSTLPLKGMSYSLKLNGYELLTGVSNDLPVIEAYSEGKVTLVAQTNLINAVRFFKNFVDHTEADALAYELTTKLDTGSLWGAIKVVEEGSVALQDVQ